MLILSGDHIYKMNYDLMLRQHQGFRRRRDAGDHPDRSQRDAALRRGGIDRNGRVVGLPGEAESRPTCALRTIREMVSASMGIYIFNTDVLIPVLLKDAEDPNSRHDFGHNILPKMVDDYKVYSFNFIDENKKEALYWRDVGTLEAYYEANMDMVSVSPVFNLYDEHWPIRTHQRQYPPAKFVFAEPGRTGHGASTPSSRMGCIVSGGMVRNSVLSPDVRVNSYFGSGFQHRVLARQYRAPLPHPERHHRPRRAHSRRHGDRL